MDTRNLVFSPPFPEEESWQFRQKEHFLNLTGLDEIKTTEVTEVSEVKYRG